MAVARDTGTRTTTSTTGTTRSNTGTGPVGLFVASYDVTTGVPGAPTLHLRLMVYAPERTVTGYGGITQAVEDPPAWATRLDGDFTYLTVMGPGSHILVTLTGYPPVLMPPGTGAGPALLPNCGVRLLLDESWQSGVGSFWYVDGNGVRHDVDDARVTRAADAAAAPAAAERTLDLGTVALLPEQVTATYAGDRLVIHASGHEDGVADIHVEESPIRIFPPQFLLVGRPSPAIGSFPYATTGVFDATGLTEVTFHADGESRSFPVT